MFDLRESLSGPEISELRSVLDQMAAAADDGLTIRELENDLVELLDARRIIRAHLFELARSHADRVPKEQPVLDTVRGRGRGGRE